MITITGGVQHDGYQRRTLVWLEHGDECDCCDKRRPVVIVMPTFPIDPLRMCRECLDKIVGQMDEEE